MFQVAGACRYIWNQFREKNLADYQAFKNGKGQRPQTSYFSLGVEFTKLRQKAGLNRAMLDTSFGEIRRNLEYKCGRLIAVNPAYTSQTCSHCGHAEKENRKTQARFLCVSCGYVSNADTNAAINIWRLGMAQLHGEERSVIKRTPTTREIDARLPHGS